MKYDLIIYIGRFQPFHNGHYKIVQEISQLAKETLILVGSKYSPRTIKNPFTYNERYSMIEKSVHVLNLTIKGINDYSRDSSWINYVNEKVKETGAKKIAIAGYHKDDSSNYLDWFPQWDFIPVQEYKEYGTPIHATDVRKQLFDGFMHYIERSVPSKVFSNLVKFKATKDFENLQYEYNYMKEYKNTWSQVPYPVTFVTTDALVVQSGHILMIQRKYEPGKDLWALPGGFVNVNQTLEDSMLRELREETGLKVPKKVLKGSITDKKVIDTPNRSLRGRTITHAFKIRLDDSNKLPHIKGSDDAKKAKWIPIADFYHMRSKMFEDHWYIIGDML